MDTSDFDAIRPYATERQAEVMDAVLEQKGIRPAARALGIDHHAVHKAIKSVRKKAAVQGVAPAHDMTRPAPDPFVVKGVSTYYDKEGKPAGQWVKTRLDAEQYAEAVREAVSAFAEDIPALPAPEGPNEFSSDVIPWINIGDAHIGMLAHAAEVGENFDLKIAERELLFAVSQLIDELPPCERIVINDLGDFTHYENFAATTEASGHVLDFDSRFPKMIRIYSRVLRAIIDKALTKCQTLDVIINQGNHSRTNDIWAAELLRVAYAHTKRVNVMDNESVFIGYRMGKTFVMVHHGDKCKPARLADVMLSDFAKDFGETLYRYIDIGHVHHSSSKLEIGGVVVESFSNLATNDRWAHDGGYRSRKSITTILRSRTYGEIGRRTLSLGEIRDRLAKAGVAVQPGKRAFVA